MTYDLRLLGNNVFQNNESLLSKNHYVYLLTLSITKLYMEPSEPK